MSSHIVTEKTDLIRFGSIFPLISGIYIFVSDTFASDSGASGFMDMITYSYPYIFPIFWEDPIISASFF